MTGDGIERLSDDMEWCCREQQRNGVEQPRIAKQWKGQVKLGGEWQSNGKALRREARQWKGEAEKIKAVE